MLLGQRWYNVRRLFGSNLKSCCPLPGVVVFDGLVFSFGLSFRLLPLFPVVYLSSSRDGFEKFLGGDWRHS